MNSLKKFSGLALAFLLTMGFLSGNDLASEIDLKIPSLDVGYNILVTPLRVHKFCFTVCGFASSV